MNVAFCFYRDHRKPILLYGLLAALLGHTVVLGIALLHEGWTALSIAGQVIGAGLASLGALALASALLVEITSRWAARRLVRIEREPLIPPIPVLEERPPSDEALKTAIARNRAEETTRARDFPRSEARCLCIYGPPGIGKSTLAATLLRKKDIWLPLNGRAVDLDTLIRLCARRLGDAILKASVGARRPGRDEIEWLIESMAGKQLRLIVDGCDPLLDAKTGKLRDPELELFFSVLLGAEHDVRVLVTSRRRPLLTAGEDDEAGADQVRYIELAGLEERHAIELLAGEGGAPADAEELRATAAAVGGNPLVLKVLAAQIGLEKSIDSVVDIVRRAAKRKTDPLRVALESLLGIDALELVFRLSLVREPLDFDRVKALGGENIDSEQVVGDLVNRCFLDFDRRTKKLALPPAVADAAEAAMAADRRKLEAAARAVAEACLGCVAGEGGTREDDAVPLTRACELYLAVGDIAAAAKTFAEARKRLPSNTHNGFLRKLGQPLAGYFAARISLKGAEAAACPGFALAYAPLLPERARAGDLIRAGLSAAKRRGDAESAARLTRESAFIHRSLGSATRALRAASVYLDAARSLEARALEADALGVLGVLSRAAGDDETAMKLFAQCRGLFSELADAAGEAKACAHLGACLEALDRKEEARECADRRIGLCREMGDLEGEAAALNSRAALHLAEGQTGKAGKLMESALKALEKATPGPALADALNNLARLHFSLENFRKAANYQQRRLEVARRTRDRATEAGALGNIANALARLESRKEAVEYYLKAARLFESLGDNSGLSKSCHGAALLHARDSNWPDASRLGAIALASSLRSGRRKVGSELRLLRRCRHELGPQNFRQACAEGVGPDLVREVERIVEQETR